LPGSLQQSLALAEELAAQVGARIHYPVRMQAVGSEEVATCVRLELPAAR
ncbi:hypothetical protein HaLaN_32150, partial [Haematococcus lacustris]